MTTLTRVAIYLPPDLADAVRKDAAERGQSLSEWWRRAAATALAEWTKTQPPKKRAA